MGDEVNEDIERALERIAQEEASTELTGEELKRWQRERESEAERELRELEARLGARKPAETEPQPEMEQPDAKPEAPEPLAPQPLERFENLEIPADTDEQSSE